MEEPLNRAYNDLTKMSSDRSQEGNANAMSKHAENSVQLLYTSVIGMIMCGSMC